MAQTANPGRPRSRLIRQRRDPLRLTALLYLREALIKERYEECAEMIEIAHEFGATPMEVQFLLEDVRRTPQS